MSRTQGLRDMYGPGKYVSPAIAVATWIKAGRPQTEHIFSALVALSEHLTHALSQPGDQDYDSSSLGQRLSGTLVARGVLVGLGQIDPRSPGQLWVARSITEAHRTTVSQLMEGDTLFSDDRLDRLKQYIDELVKQGLTDRSAQVAMR